MNTIFEQQMDFIKYQPDMFTFNNRPRVKVTDWIIKADDPNIDRALYDIKLENGLEYPMELDISASKEAPVVYLSINDATLINMLLARPIEVIEELIRDISLNLPDDLIEHIIQKIKTVKRNRRMNI